MAGVAIEMEIDAAAAVAALSALSEADLAAIADIVGQLVEDQTKDRIWRGKTAPDGAPWAPWSTDYAKTRRPKNSLLVGEGNPGLLESVQNYTAGSVVRVGTPLIYGAIHQFGGAGVGSPGLPARPYLGLSDENRRDIEELVIGEIEELMA